MKRWLIVSALLLGLLAPAAAFWQSRDSNYNVNVVSGGGTNNLAIDAFSNLASQTTASSSVTITTTHTNDILVACSQANSSPPSGISDTAALTWTQIGTRTGTTAVFYAKSSGTLSSDSITVTYGGSSFNTLQVVAVSGANFTTPLDSNAALPATTTTSTPLSFTTSNANDILIACYAENSGSASAGSGWTAFTGGMTGFAANEYKIVSATQSATSAPLTTGTIKNGIGTALVSQ